MPISSIRFDRDLPMNSAGRVALLVDFEDGSQGIYITTVPEPTTFALLACASIALTSRRRR